MKIISTYKDYYDFYTGIYGEDPLLILDRRNHIQPDLYSPQKIILYVCDYVFEGFFDGEKVYWGEDLLKFGDVSSGWKKTHTPYVHIIHYQWRDFDYGNIDVALTPQRDLQYRNIKTNCPILMSGRATNKVRETVTPFPKLSDLNFSSIVKPDEMYKALSAWLSYQKTCAENTLDTRSDKQKIASKGFNVKTSFRPNMK